MHIWLFARLSIEACCSLDCCTRTGGGGSGMAAGSRCGAITSLGAASMTDCGDWSPMEWRRRRARMASPAFCHFLFSFMRANHPRIIRWTQTAASSPRASSRRVRSARCSWRAELVRVTLGSVENGEEERSSSRSSGLIELAVSHKASGATGGREALGLSKYITAQQEKFSATRADGTRRVRCAHLGSTRPRGARLARSASHSFAGWHSPPSLLPIRMHASAPPPEAWRALFLETARKRKQRKPRKAACADRLRASVI